MLMKRKSDWTFDTSKSSGAGVGFVGVEGGTLWLKPPKAQTSMWFNYATVGVGASIGLKLGASYSGKDFPNRGDIWILPAFKGNELTTDDITGFCTTAEVTVGPGAFTAMFLGVSAGDFYKELAVDEVEYLSVGGAIIDYLLDKFDRDWPEFLQSSANALLVMEAVSGSTAAVGALGGWGYVGRTPPPKPHSVPMPPPGPDEIEIRTTNSGHETAVIIPGDALFDFDKDQIRTEDEARRKGGTANEPLLKKAGEIIKSHQVSNVLIQGHTDAVGGDVYNIDLSQRRARNVAQWLISHGYVEADRVKWLGSGKRFPVASNKNAKGRRKNRRVEIKIFA